MNNYLSKTISTFGLYPRIYVTGPQRSGTRIASNIISHELGIRLFDESEFGASDITRLKALTDSTSRFVVHCPALASTIHKTINPTDLVVFMIRPISDIIASQERIHWDYEHLELEKYGLKKGIISVVKYSFWQRTQKPLIQNHFDLYYQDLRTHSFFVPIDKRSHFSWNQIA